MKSKKKQKAYQPIIPEGDSIRKRIEHISTLTGKKMYAVAGEAIIFGLAVMERQLAKVGE